MKRVSGLIALLAILAAGAHYVGPRARPGSSANLPVSLLREAAVPESTECEAFAESPAASPTSATEQTANSKGEITLLMHHFLHGTPVEAPVPVGMLPAGMKFVIATVPDPVHTHLSLQFDRSLEAIQQAAQDERYTYDSSWLPWKSQGAEYSSLTDQAAATKEAARRELCPGLILFRRNTGAPRPRDCEEKANPIGQTWTCGMLVFVVGEKPTSGVDINQWHNALDWIERHTQAGARDRPLRILGPTFSGTMPSIVRAIKEPAVQNGPFTSVLLYSGRIRGCSSWRWLQFTLHPAAAAGLPVRVSDFEENDAIQIDRFYRYLEDRGHRLSEVAILSEDETAYGGLPDARGMATDEETAHLIPCDPVYPANDRPVHLYYPRDISAIRSAYQEQSIFSTDAQSEPRVVLRPEANDSAHNETDTIEPFSGPNMALTQEAQLYGIVNTLRTHSIRYVVLRSTNSLDYLFLTRFLHRAYAAAYIVTMGTDLLFGREIDSTEFRGVLALSNFPLLPRGQDWTRQTDQVRQHAHRVFGSYTMEGDYLAARFLITDPGASPGEANNYVHPAKPDIPDFAPPFWETHAPVSNSLKPSTWISVIGRDGYWPLAVLWKPSVYSKTPRFSSLTSVQKPADEPGAPGSAVRNLLTLSATWKFCCALALLAACAHFFVCLYGWAHPDLGMCIQFTPLPGRRGLGLMALGWAVVCSVLILISMASLRLFMWLDGLDRFWVVLSSIGALASLVLAVAALRPWIAANAHQVIDARQRTDEPAETSARLECQCSERPSKLNPQSRPQSLWVWLVLTFVPVILFFIGAWRIFGYGQATSDGITIAYRSVHLTSGVSPIISLLLMLAGFYWWFWQNLSGLALLGNGRPVLPGLECLPAGLGRVGDAMASEIESTAMPFPRRTGLTRWIYVLPFVLVIGQAVVLQRPWSQPLDLVLHSLENTDFNWTLHTLFGIALYLLLLECAQLLITWLGMKRLLTALNRLPLRRTFEALPGLSMRSLWSLSGTSSRARYQIFSHQMESLLHLRNELDAFDFRDCGTPALKKVIHATWNKGLAFVGKRCTGVDRAMVNDVDAFLIRSQFSSCTHDIFKDLLAPEWLAERAPIPVRDTGSDGKSGEQTPLSESSPVRIAEGFACMIYVGYIQNMLARMRTMALSIAGIFAAIALSVAFYPYTPRPTIALSLTLLFVFVAAVVGSVYAGLDRDSTLSHITNTTPGSLGASFWLRILSFAGVPALSLIVAQFPEITDFVASWIQPGINAMK